MMIILFLLISPFSFADENIRSAAALLSEGFRPVVAGFSHAGTEAINPHSLNWPVTFQDKSHSLANSMAQYQPFGAPYFHGGCDLRVRARENVFSPVSGKLEAGHYGYSKNEDGSLNKFWKPWPEQGEELYFEVAVIDSAGIRYEFHHVDRRSLPASIVQKLNSGNETVSAGELLGSTVYWMGSDYHHIHYNVILPDLTRVNPEFVSPLLEDTISPEIRGAYAMTENRTENFGNGKFSKRPLAFVVNVLDRKNESVYENPPVKAEILFANGESFAWNFREQLKKDGKFPKLNEFFVRSLRTPEGRTISTEGGYGTGQSLIRLPIPEKASGDFVITLEDMNGNQSRLEGAIP